MLARNINLFLDIDGVLHPDSVDICRTLDVGDMELEDVRVAMVRGIIHPHELLLLCKDRQELLACFLLNFPQVSIVLSSAWRNWTGYNYMRSSHPHDFIFETQHVETLDWLKGFLHPVIASRLIGKTGMEFNRLLEVRNFERVYSGGHGPLRWIALDDQQRNIPLSEIVPFYSEYTLPPHFKADPRQNELVVLVDGKKGLSCDSIAALYKAASLLTEYDEAYDAEVPCIDSERVGRQDSDNQSSSNKAGFAFTEENFDTGASSSLLDRSEGPRRSHV
jgi:hypothetical protein